MAHTDWEDHKAEIEHLYIRQDKALKDVMEILRTRTNFHNTYCLPAYHRIVQIVPFSKQEIAARECIQKMGLAKVQTIPGQVEVYQLENQQTKEGTWAG